METLFPDNHLTIRVKPETTGFFSTLLQSGMLVKSKTDNTINGFLSQLPGFTSTYIEEKVQTIFLNGTATDNIETSLPGPECTLAVTTAMPGLAGAIFRKDSRHAALRTTSCSASIDSETKETIVTLKLFNVLAKERGPGLLDRGIVVKTYDLLSFLNYRPTLLEKAESCTLDGDTVTTDGLQEAIKGSTTIHLRVHS